jgi:hypothetical protein
MQLSLSNAPKAEVIAVGVAIVLAILFGVLAIFTLIYYRMSPVPKTRRRRRRRPLRSTKRDAKRKAWEYARKVTGNPRLTWKRARQLLAQWEREGKALEREAASMTPSPETKSTFT